MKLRSTRIFFGSMLLALVGAATTPAQAQPPAAAPTQPAPAATTAPAPAATAPAAAQPTAPAATPAPTGVPGAVEGQPAAAAPSAAPPVSTPKPPPPRPEPHVTGTVIGAAALGGVGIATGLVFAGLASKDKSDYDDMAAKTTGDVQDGAASRAANDKAVSGEKKAFVADIAFGLGALFGIAALALYYFPDDQITTSASAPKVVPPLSQRTAKSWLKSAVTGRLEF